MIDKIKGQGSTTDSVDEYIKSLHERIALIDLRNLILSEALHAYALDEDIGTVARKAFNRLAELDKK